MGQGLVVILTPWNTQGGAGIGSYSKVKSKVFNFYHLEKHYNILIV